MKDDWLVCQILSRFPSQKLRLFNGNTRQELTLENTLETEMNENTESLFNGSELILEYVQEGGL